MSLAQPGEIARSAGAQADRALIAEAIEGARLATRLRVVCAPVIMAFLAVSMLDAASLLFVEACLATYLAIGVAYYLHLRRTSAPRALGSWIMVTADMALIAVAMFGSQAFFDHPWPPQAFVDSHTVIYFFFVMALAAFSLSPALMLWAAAVAAAGWSAGMAWLWLLPDTLHDWTPAASPEARQAIIFDPHYVDLSVWLQDVLMILVTGLVLAAVVWRTRRLVRRQIVIARERANLARHFAPTMVDEIAHHDGMLEEVRRQTVAVMFADVVGFTRLAEELDPVATVLVLRGLHRRLETAVFEHGGTLDKFLGDGVMATFGTPRPGDRDAANALAAALAAHEAVDRWNAKRRGRGARPIRLAIGLHLGEVVLGDVGTERRLEYAVIGDTVNVTARLEHLCRELDARIVASDDLVAEARRQGADVSALEPSGEHPIRGRAGAVALWRLPA